MTQCPKSLHPPPPLTPTSTPTQSSSSSAAAASPPNYMSLLNCAMKCLYTGSVAITKRIPPTAENRSRSASPSTISSQQQQLSDNQASNVEMSTSNVHTDELFSEYIDNRQSKKPKLYHIVQESHIDSSMAQITDTNIISKKDPVSENGANEDEKKNSSKEWDREHIITTFQLPKSSGINLLREKLMKNDIESDLPSEYGTSKCDMNPLHEYNIHVKPLLVLDLNGILCHRFKKDDVPVEIKRALHQHNAQQEVDEQLLEKNTEKSTDTTDNSTVLSESNDGININTGTDTTANASDANTSASCQKIEIRSLYRTSIANIARTPIVPRQGLKHFLKILDQSFTLAIWTSATNKTAKELVNVLFPKDIRSRLLFVWNQDHCETVSAKEMGLVNSRRSTIFRKHLCDVWKSYPIWNQENTLLMDDSPEKCPKINRGNGLHPPPLSGLKSSSLDWIRKGSSMAGSPLNEEHVLSFSDDHNVGKQKEFFHDLVMAWKSSSDGAFLASYLSKFAKGHMGWRGSVDD